MQLNILIFRNGLNNRENFDLSKSEREDLNCKDNENVLGKVKDELHSMVMKEFLALNPKRYVNMIQNFTK